VDQGSEALGLQIRYNGWGNYRRMATQEAGSAQLWTVKKTGGTKPGRLVKEPMVLGYVTEN
jgi:hypothetical protein